MHNYQGICTQSYTDSSDFAKMYVRDGLFPPAPREK